MAEKKYSKWELLFVGLAAAFIADKLAQKRNDAPPRS